MQAQYKMVDDKTGRYLPFIYPEELPFWEGTKNRQLKLQRCSDCHKAWYPIGSTCPHCLSAILPPIPTFPLKGEGEKC